MFCTKCGAQNPADARFCYSCGAALPTTDISPPQAQVGAPMAQPPAAARVVEYAGFWRRFVAVIIDGLILTVPNLILSFVIGWLYYAFFESSRLQATPGKMALGIVVTDTEGQRITFLRASGRQFGKIISAFILYIGFMMAGWTRKKQALHDLLAECLVVMR
jgi:uncharacterized RDD family membrane protein YckC